MSDGFWWPVWTCVRGLPVTASAVKRLSVFLVVLFLAGGCGGGSTSHHASHDAPARVRGAQTVGADGPTPSREARPPAPEALVTAETENRLIAVDMRTGRVIRRVSLPADPENVAISGVAIVVSPGSHTVSLVSPDPLRVVKELHGFSSPEIVAVSPDGEYAYVTDAIGTVSVIQLSDARIVDRVDVGAGAHHMSFRPDQRQLWVALGESATTIEILDTSDIAHPHLVGSFHPGFPAHDLSFSPDGRTVWITSADGPDVSVFSAGDHRLLFRVPVGPAPQHIAFDGPDAYLTSGYGGRLERVAANSGRVLGRARSPHGSFELDVADGYVATSSLLRGTVAIYSLGLRPERVVHVAPAAREVAIWSQDGPGGA
jgi:DNA-binding beta-propeller fold protein YncE